jgi:3-hydroxyacyl-[acyl-carrier-protein] dehydratase
MMLDDDVAAVYRRAEKEPLTEDRPEATLLDRAAVMAVLPHRDPFLLVDRVTRVDHERRLIVARYDLARARDVLAGHFPARPMYPGVLHIEAIGQAGILLALLAGGDRVESITLTHVRAARFVRAVEPGGELELVTHVIDDGLFLTVVGQCLQGGLVCSAAVASGLVG